MTLIDRYLRSVRDYLPAGEQSDIIRELSEDMHAQVADREAELGRPLTDGEQEAVLKQYGHPLLLASKYRPQRHLIGPALFPFYVLGLKMALGIAVVVHLGLAFSLLIAGSPVGDILRPLIRFPFGAAVSIFGWVTLGFATADLMIERTRTNERCSPRSLREPSGINPRLQVIVEAAAATGFFFWWLSIPRYPLLVLGPAAAFTQLAPVFDRLFLPISAAWLLGIVMLWTLVLRPGWIRYRHAARIATNLTGVVMASLFLKAGSLVVPVEGATGDAVRFVAVIEMAGRIGLAVYIGFCVFEIAKAGLKLRGEPVEA